MESHVMNDPELSFKKILKLQGKSKGEGDKEEKDEDEEREVVEKKEEKVPPLKINLLNFQQVKKKTIKNKIVSFGFGFQNSLLVYILSLILC